MKLVIIFLIIMFAAVGLELGVLVYYMKHDDDVTDYGTYTSQVKERTRNVMRALKFKVIKKHLLTNSAEKYDSKKILRQYKGFLSSDLMKDLTQVHEERYHG